MFVRGSLATDYTEVLATDYTDIRLATDYADLTD